MKMEKKNNNQLKVIDLFLITLDKITQTAINCVDFST